MKAEFYRSVVSECFPQLKIHSIAFLAEGWDSFVWEVNGDVVFRFPKRAEVEAQLKKEAGLLPKLKRSVSAAIPVFSLRKAEYVMEFARKVSEGSPDLEALERMEDEKAIEYLTGIRGVGRWTAECILLLGLGRPDLLPADDIGLRNAVTRAYTLDHQATEAEVRQIGESWRPWRSWVTRYLWLSLGE